MDSQTVICKPHGDWKAYPIKAHEEVERISKYGTTFNPRNIENLAEDKLRKNFRNSTTGLLYYTVYQSVYCEIMRK